MKGVSDIAELLALESPTVPGRRRRGKQEVSGMSREELEKLVVTLEEEMYVAAEELRFEYAAKLRDEIKELRRELNALADCLRRDARYTSCMSKMITFRMSDDRVARDRRARRVGSGREPRGVIVEAIDRLVADLERASGSTARSSRGTRASRRRPRSFGGPRSRGVGRSRTSPGESRRDVVGGGSGAGARPHVVLTRD